MADGEMCPTGAEIATDIDVTVSVVKDPPVAIDRPVVVTSEAIKTLASAETMEAAARLATRDAQDLLMAEYGFDRTDASMFSSLVGGLESSVRSKVIYNPLEYNHYIWPSTTKQFGP